MKETYEKNIKQLRFNLNLTVDMVTNLFPEDLQEIHGSFSGRISETVRKNVIRGLVRFVFLIELVKDDVTSTKYELRWSERLNDDPRFSSFEECLSVFRSLLIRLGEDLTPARIELLNDFSKYSVLPYELPLDYCLLPENNGRIHILENVTWLWNQSIFDTLKLRSLLVDPAFNQEWKFFSSILSDKIKVKTYLTDRALTGVNKTNREKRWETHPKSVQFALKKDCLEIEKTLLLQLCRFQGAPLALVNNLVAANLLPQNYETFLCPITGDELIFDDFKEEILNMTHGRSKFQVGHLNPLKANNNDPNFGHSARNISWISEDGNRIQGSLTLEKVNQLLSRIKNNRLDL